MRTRSIALAGLFAGALLLAACGSSTTTTAGSGSGSGGASSASPSAQADFNAADVTFAQNMRPHHSQAVEMAQTVLDKNPPPQVAAVAQRIKAAQSPEIQQIDAMLQHFGVTTGGSSTPGTGGSMPGMDDGSMPMPSGSSSAPPTATGSPGTTGDGMMSAAQMSQLSQAASGTPAAKVFLQLMQEHHKGAIAMAETEIANGKYQPAITMAKNIRDSQTAEITEMQQLLSQL